MKKIISSIFIFTILTGIFAPFSYDLKTQRIDKNVANAGTKVRSTIKQESSLDTSIEISGDIIATPDVDFFSIYNRQHVSIGLVLKDESGNLIKEVKESDNKNDPNLEWGQFYTDKNDDTVIHFTYIFKDLTPNSVYKLYSTSTYTIHYSVSGIDDKATGVGYPNPVTLKTSDTSNNGKTLQNSLGGDILPACGLGAYFGTGDGTFPGCIAQVAYYALFIPTSYLFGLAGLFFDNVFIYSVSDSSYRTSFVTQGWGIVRDFCNILFIFILMYAAFKMILNIGHGEKGTIIAVIIIGLLINFSLFATKVMIDSSNILARLFYSSDSLKVTVDKSGGSVSHGGVNLYDKDSGILPLSAGIIGKIEPQALIINASQVSVVDDTQGTSSSGSEGKTNFLGIGAFFLVIILATIINIIGTFVFLSVGLIFVARVIGLWFAMIFVPFAFLSYTVPSLQGVKMIGWKSWWSDTLGMCFLAPIFMFFLYLILVFLEKGFTSLLGANSGPNMVLNIILPFAFIMIMLMMAKKLAKDYSGSMGQSITGAVAAAGGLALGGAALGAAFVGRTAIAKPLKKIANSEGAMRHAENMKAWEDGGRVGPKPQASFMAKWGYRMNKREEDQGHILHTRHELDDIAKKEFNGQTYEELGTAQKNKVKEALTKEKAEKKHNALARSKYDSDYKDLSDDKKRDIRTMALDQAKHQVEHSADRKISLRDSLSTSMRKGSYDVRNISDININKMDSWQNKLSSSIVKAISGGMRGGLKNMADINYGKGQKDFFKDLGHTITEAIKSAKFVSIPTGGGGGGHDHGGGHDDHGGGHH